MELGIIGLGRMGANMVRRITRGGHTCVGYARRAEVIEALVAEGMVGATPMGATCTAAPAVPVTS